MRMKKSNIALSTLLVIALAGACGCHSAQPRQLFDSYFSRGGPRQVVNKYLSSAVKQDYATTYECYYDAYKAKVTKDEFIKHRKEASTLQSYQIASLTQKGDTAQAEVVLTFAPSEKLKRAQPVSTTIKEDLVRQANEWKIKVW